MPNGFEYISRGSSRSNFAPADNMTRGFELPIRAVNAGLSVADRKTSHCSFCRALALIFQSHTKFLLPRKRLTGACPQIEFGHEGVSNPEMRYFFTRSRKLGDYAESYVSTSHPAKAGQIDAEPVKNSHLWMGSYWIPRKP